MATVGAAVTSRCGRSAAANRAWGLRLLGLQKERRLRGAAGGVAVVVARAGDRGGTGRPRARATRIAEDWISELQRANKALYGCPN